MSKLPKTDTILVEMKARPEFEISPVFFVEVKDKEIIIHTPNIFSAATTSVIRMVTASMNLKIITKRYLTLTDRPLNGENEKLFVPYYEEILISP